MAAFVIYIFKWALSLTLLYSLYGALRRETFHTLNRAVLLAILVVSMVLPLCRFTTTHPTVLNTGVSRMEQMLTDREPELPSAPTPSAKSSMAADVPSVGSDAGVQDDGGGVAAGRPINWWLCLTFIYMAGVVVAWGLYLYSLMCVVRLLHGGRRIAVAGVPQWVHVVVSDRVRVSCSWMRWVVVSATDVVELPSDGSFVDADANPILTHELAHVRRGHSWDKLFCEAVCRTLWFLPFAWMLRRDLADVHEFEADRAVLRAGVNRMKYNMLIIEKAVSAGLQPVVNAFNESKTKKRMKMMFQKKSTRVAALKALYLLPLAAVVTTAFARPQLLDEVEAEITQALPSVRPSVAVQPVADAAEAVAEMAEAVEAVETEAVATLPTTEPTLEAVPTTDDGTEPMAVAVLDSTMTSVGARRIAEGVYVGRFKPNYTSDTIRVRQVNLNDSEGNHLAEHTFAQHDGVGNWQIDLQVEERAQFGRGWHIRWMTCDAPAEAEFHDRRDARSATPVEIASVTDYELHRFKQNFHLEQHPDETWLVVYRPVNVNEDTFTFSCENFYIEDVATGDMYACRRLQNYDAKNVNIPVKAYENTVLQMTFVFPPLPKSVKRIRFTGNVAYARQHTYKVKDLLRRPKRIIQ
ncbi:MAG: hypothetical protein J1F25_01055 [Prevotellaceae bacterium]|nr:hypothetical protein [Prevotellaceae bacterium]